MKIELVKKQILYHVTLDRTKECYAYLGRFDYIRDEDGNWHIDDHDWETSQPLSSEKSAPLEEAYIDYVERIFNGCH